MKTRRLLSKPINTDRGGAAKTVLAGYYKYGVRTLLTGEYGTSGTIVMEIYESAGIAESAEELRKG